MVYPQTGTRPQAAMLATIWDPTESMMLLLLVDDENKVSGKELLQYGLLAAAARR